MVFLYMYMVFFAMYSFSPFCRIKEKFYLRTDLLRLTVVCSTDEFYKAGNIQTFRYETAVDHTTFKLFLFSLWKCEDHRTVYRWIRFHIIQKMYSTSFKKLRISFNSQNCYLEKIVTQYYVQKIMYNFVLLHFSIVSTSFTRKNAGQ